MLNLIKIVKPHTLKSFCINFNSTYINKYCLADVIHSFAVPSLGIKIDAVPGRLNQTSILCERTGTFYGQCSEICGVWHGFMPIAIEAVSVQDYLAWVDAA